MSQKRAKLLIYARKNRSVGLLTLTAPVLETNVASSRVFSGRGETLLRCSRPTPTVRPAPAPALESPPAASAAPGHLRSERPAGGRGAPSEAADRGAPSKGGLGGGGSDTAQPPTPTYVYSLSKKLVLSFSFHFSEKECWCRKMRDREQWLTHTWRTLMKSTW